MSDTDLWAILALALGVAMIVFNRRVGRWTAAPPWPEGSRGEALEEAYQRRYPRIRPLYSPRGRAMLARAVAVMFGLVFVALGLAGLL